jgi:hypothetical protein
MRRPPSPKKDYAASERPGMRHPRTCHYPKECPLGLSMESQAYKKGGRNYTTGIEKETEN